MDENNILNEPQEKEDNRTINYNTNYNTNYNKNKNKGCFFAFILGIIAIVGAIIIALAGIGLLASAFMGDSGEAYASYPYVGLLDISGTIEESYDGSPVDGTYSHPWALKCIDSFKEDELNKGLILYINSPGGGIYESDELYNKIMDYKEETGRPVFAYMAQEAASGGLYVAMAADEITANRMTLTGSIGVIMSSMDFSGLYEKLGIETVDIVSGENKDMFTNMTLEQKQILQEMIDEYYGYFVEVIADSRNLDEDYVREISDGRVYTATQAKEIGLIDSIATYDDFVDGILNLPQFQDCEIMSFEYYEPDLIDYLFNSIGLKSNASESYATDEAGNIIMGRKQIVQFK